MILKPNKFGHCLIDFCFVSTKELYEQDQDQGHDQKPTCLVPKYSEDILYLAPINLELLINFSLAVNINGKILKYIVEDYIHNERDIFAE